MFGQKNTRSTAEVAAGARQPAPQGGTTAPAAAGLKDAGTDWKELARTAQLFKAISIARSVPFHCFLDEPPSGLVPLRFRQAMASDTGSAKLIVNPSFRFQPDEEWPGEVGDPGLSQESFLPGHPLAWIQDPGTNVWTPYWLRGEFVQLLRSLVPGEAPPSGLQQPTLGLLEQASLLVPDDYQEVCESQWERTCQDAQAQVQSHGYAIVRDLIHPLQLAAMRRYYRDVLGTGQLQLGHGQVPKRYSIHNEILASFFHRQLAGLVSRVVGEAVKPSYAYFASYEPGAVLSRHVDRQQCEFSISFLVDYDPEPQSTSGWPLFLEKEGPPRVAAAADLAIGDGVVYKGCELEHYREELPKGHRSTSIFFHYVHEAFNGDLW